MTILFFVLAAFDYSLKANVSLTYDDNIFSYSKKHLEEFIQNLNPAKYPFKTYDDMSADYGLQILLRNRFFASRTTTINLNFTSHNFIINKQKDYLVFVAGLRQSLGNWALKFEYLFLPSYLIRYYRDPSGTAYIGCEFSEHLLTIKVSSNINKNTMLTTTLGYEIDDYIDNFDVYDSKAIRAEPAFSHKFSRVFEVATKYEYKNSRARGPVPDISYQQHSVRVGLNTYLPFVKLSQFGTQYQIRYRAFSTELSPIIDSPHSGRQDFTHNFSADLRLPVFTSLYYFLGYSYELRNSYSEVYEDIAELKNYNKWVLKNGLEFRY